MTRKEYRNREGRKTPKFFVIGLISFCLFFVLPWFFLDHRAQAATPPAIITYQGKLLSGGSSVSTTQSMKFILYDAVTSGNALYTAAGTVGTPTAISVTPTSGLFSVNLGDTGTNSLDQSIFQGNATVYLEVQVGSETLSPRKQITAVPYAYNAKYLDGVQATSTASSSTHIPVSDSSGIFNFRGFIANSSSTFSSRLHITKNLSVSSTITWGATGVNILGDPNSATDIYIKKRSSDGADAVILLEQLSTSFTPYTSYYAGVGGATSTLYTGIENSSGGYLLTGSFPYAGVINQRENHPLQFGTSNAVRMSILGNGNVGIGIASSSYPLNVHGANAMVGVSNGSTTSSLEYNKLVIASSTTDGLGKFYVDSSGNVSATGSLRTFGNVTSTGIIYASGGFISNASSSISSRLNVSGNISASTTLTWGATGVNILGDPSSATDIYIKKRSNDSADALILLEQLSTSFTPYTAYYAGAGGVTSTLYTGIENSSGGYLLAGSFPYAGVINQRENHPLQFGTSNAVRMTILGNGNVGIGIASSSYKLNVHGAGAMIGVSNGSTTSSLEYNKLVIASSTTNGLGKFFVDSSGNVSASGTSLLAGHVYPQSGNVYDLGSASTSWRNIYASSTLTVGGNTASNAVSLNVTDMTRDFIILPSLTANRINIGNSSNHDLAFFTNNTARIALYKWTAFGPLSNNTIDLGTATTSWANVYASGTVNFGNTLSVTGAITGSSTLTIGSGGNLGKFYIDSSGNAFASGTLQIYGSATSTIISGVGTSTFAYGVILSTSTQGFVGVGTTTPETKLHLYNGTLLVDAPNPATSTSQLSSSASEDIVVSGRYAYVADSTDGLKIIDVSDPYFPTVISTLASFPGRSVAVSGQYAYITDTSGNFDVVDVANPKNPNVIATISIGGDEDYQIYIAGKYAYVAHGINGLNIIDITNPYDPKITGKIIIDGVEAVYVSGKHAYVATGGNFGIIDISKPTRPVFVTTTLFAASIQSMKVSGRYAYLAQGNDGLRIMDVSDPLNATTTSRLATTNAKDVFLAGKYAYVADDTSIKVIDVASSTRPMLVSTIASQTATRLTIAGKYLYAAGGADGFRIFDLKGADISTANIGALSTNNLTVWENTEIGNSLYVRTNLNIGFGGLLSHGALSVSVTSTTSTPLLQLSGAGSNNFMTTSSFFSGDYLILGAGTSTYRATAGGTSGGGGMFSINQNGNISASGTSQIFGLETQRAGFISNASSSISAGLQVAGALNASGTLQVSGNTSFTGNIFSVNAADTTLLLNSTGIVVSANGSITPNSDNADSLGSQARRFSQLEMSNYIRLGSVASTFNTGKFNVDSSGNASASGTLILYGGASTGGFTVSSTNATTTFMSYSTNAQGSAGFAFNTLSSFASTTAGTPLDRALFVVQNANVNKFAISGGGNVYASKGFNANSTEYGIGDVAEYIDLVSGESVEPGDVVTVDLAGGNRYRKSNNASAQNVAGVISDTGAFVIGASGESRAPLALVGLVITKVTDENGPIIPGDTLITASKPGYAMKYNPMQATTAVGIVGTATESLVQGEGKIKVLVRGGLVNPTPTNFAVGGAFSMTSPSFNQLFFNTTTVFTSAVANSSGAHAFIFNAENFSPTGSSDRYLLSLRSNDTPVFSVAQNGDVHAAGSYYGQSAVLGTPGTPGDLAERVDVSPDDLVEAGDVMMVDPESSDTYRRTAGSYEQAVAGVISTNPTVVVGNGKTDYTAVLAMVGRVPVKVTSQNGPIKQGDLLVSASVAGYAMRYDPTKDDGPKMVGVIGVALDSFDKQGTGKIMALIRTGWARNQTETITELREKIAAITLNGSLGTATTTPLNVGANDGQITYNGGDLNLLGNTLLNVATIVGKDNRWRIDETGRFITRLNTSIGQKEMVALQSPTAEFVFSSSSQMVGGIAQITFDQEIQDILDPTQPVKVTVTLTSAGSKGIYVTEKNSRGFAVKEIDGAQGSASFDWMVVAKRKDYVVGNVSDAGVFGGEVAGEKITDPAPSEPSGQSLWAEPPALPSESTTSTGPAPEEPVLPVSSPSASSTPDTATDSSPNSSSENSIPANPGEQPSTSTEPLP